MQKILRLSAANIRKHKKQTVLLALLIMICMAVTSAAAAGSADILDLFPRVAEENAVHKNALYIREDYYSDAFPDMLREDKRVTDTGTADVLYSTSTKYLDDSGDERALYMSFITAEMEKRAERSPVETALSEAEISSLEHPIYMPYGGRDSLSSKYREGDTFDVIYGSKRFSFTVAGFYESYFMPETNVGFQMIVSDSDYIALMTVIDKYRILMFDCTDNSECEDIANSFIRRAEEHTGKDAGMKILDFCLYTALKVRSTAFSGAIIPIMLFMSAVIFTAAAVMIRFRIAGDIQDQIQSIGVLEALGYTSRELTLAYTAEYLITALPGIVIGTFGGLALIPVVHRVGETLAGHHGVCRISVLPIFLTAAVILLFMGLIAYTKATLVKKYPPVLAFRKGIAVHHFARDPFPLRNTRRSVHIRIAMKSFFGSVRQSAGLIVCIAVSAFAAVVGLLIADMFSSDLKVAERLAGTEIPELTVSVVDSADAEELAAEINGMQGVRKVRTGSYSLDAAEWLSIYAFDRSQMFTPICYEDFSDCESILATAGRLPEHDNEVAVSKLMASSRKLKIGDNITLESDRTKKNYIICGTIASMTNNGSNIYITEPGIKRLIPVYRPCAIEIYLEDGTDKKTFQTMLTQTYGRTIADTRKDSGSAGSTVEERLRAAAEQQIAEYLSNHGAEHIEYSIQIGGRVISGSSGSFVIKNIQDLARTAETQIGGLFSTISMTARVLMGISAAAAMMIIITLMEQVIRRQRKELGIMLGLGYTTRELMFQLAMRIMPAAVFSVAIGTAAAVAAVYAFLEIVVGTITVSIPMLAAAAVIMILFCFGCAYLGGYRIKKISVTELMTE